MAHEEASGGGREVGGERRGERERELCVGEADPASVWHPKDHCLTFFACLLCQ